MDKVTKRREHGTMEHHPKNPDERIAAFRQVVEEKSYAKIDNTMVDLFSANYVVQIYDVLSKANQEKYASHKAHCMVHIAFKLVGEST